VSIGPGGATAIVGTIEEKVDFGGGALSAEHTDAFVASFDATGKHVWSKSFGRTGFDVAHDRDGNVIVIGDLPTNATADLGGGPFKTGPIGPSFVAKYDAKGNHVWNKTFDVDARGVAVDSSGNIIVVGTFGSKVDFGGGPLLPAGTSSLGRLSNVFAVKLDPKGNHTWSKRFGSGTTFADSVASDAAGNVIIAGRLMGAVDFGSGPPAGGTGWNLFVTKLGPGGEHLWGKAFGGATAYDNPAVAVDPSGSVVFAGSYTKDLDLGGGVLTSHGGDTEGFLAKLSPDGAHVWSKALGGGGHDVVEGVAVNASGMIGLTGSFHQTAEIGGSPLKSAGDADVFVAKYDPSGTHLVSKRFGGPKWDAGSAVAFDRAGTLLATGRFEGSVDLEGGAPLTSAGKVDLFVASFAP